MTQPTFPDANTIAQAVVMAAKLLEEDPERVAATLPHATGASRARHLAMAALREAFPEAQATTLFKCLGYAGNASAQLAMARKRTWWRDDLVDEIVGALVAPLYGEQAQ